MNDSARVIGIIAFLLLLFFGMGIVVQDAILGIIIIFLAVMILSITMDPASAKAMFKIFLPVVMLMLILTIVIGGFGGITFSTAVLLTLIIFAVFIMIGAFMGGAEFKSLIILGPLIIVPTLLAFLADPTGNLAVIISSTLIFGYLTLTLYLVRQLGPAKEIEIPLKVGVATEDIDPHGKVKVGSEVWRAFAPNWRIKKGEKIFVTGRRGLELIVVPAVECPSCGEIYPVSAAPQTCKSCGLDLSTVILDVLKSHMKETSEVRSGGEP